MYVHRSGAVALKRVHRYSMNDKQSFHDQYLVYYQNSNHGGARG